MIKRIAIVTLMILGAIYCLAALIRLGLEVGL